jgi:hypothetical protein
MYSHLNFITPRECSGQVIELSYAVDVEREEIVCREHDRSDGATNYSVSSLDNLVGKFEPQNTEPTLVDAGLWSAVETRTIS